MTAADIDPAVAAILRRRLGRPAVAGSRSPSTIRRAGSLVAEVDGAGRRAPASPRSTARRPGSGRSGSRRPWRGQGLGRRLTEATIDVGRGRRLPHARPRRDRRRSTAVRTTRLRGPDVVPDPRGARAAAATPASRPVRAVPTRRTSPRWCALDRAATGEDRAPRADGLRDADDDPGRDGPGRRRSAGFVVRAPWGGGATIAPDPEAALRPPRRPSRRLPRRPERCAAACSNRTPKVSTRLAADSAGPRRGSAPRLDRGPAARLGPDRDLGPVQPRHGLTGHAVTVRPRRPPMVGWPWSWPSGIVDRHVAHPGPRTPSCRRGRRPTCAESRPGSRDRWPAVRGHAGARVAT